MKNRVSMSHTDEMLLFETLFRRLNTESKKMFHFHKFMDVRQNAYNNNNIITIDHRSTFSPSSSSSLISSPDL
ncbi:hypothetical protein QVD17_15152 [Tagetes erecta]|uniref:Uncharacterized protein n=1 Tax=Tagetes erecta TaxID=13708 RepID=A0AAD8KPA1_TARER|nr:hypothetical protein QVD17_15152 [Tagetes erecta]